MSFAWARRAALGVVLSTPLVACGARDSSSASPGPDADAGVEAGGAVVSFDQTGVLRAVPHQSIDLGVAITGADAGVSVWLDGDYGDASLSAGDLTTSGGRATVTLHAPSTAATFAVRARVSGAGDARLDVSVSASGFATIHVVPTYAGQRAAPGVTASVFVQTTCAELASGALKDGNPIKEGLLAPIDIDSVPAGSHVAVSVRVRFYASGCEDIASLVPNATSPLPIAILDRPMALDRTNLDASFTFAPDGAGTAAWSSMLDAAVTQAGAAFIPAGATESAALLDASRALVPSASQAAFDAARVAGGWDAVASTWLKSRAPTLASRALTWLDAGKPDDLGTLSAHLATGDGPGYSTVSLTSFGPFNAGLAGMSVLSPFGWMADANDAVHLAGTVHLWPTALVTLSADARATADVTGAADVSTALATQIDCAGLATALVGAGTSYPSCDATCTATLLRGALAAMWRRAKTASADVNDDVSIGMTASAPAVVGDNAEPVQFAGAWLGRVGRTTIDTFSMKGAASGKQGVIPH